MARPRSAPVVVSPLGPAILRWAVARGLDVAPIAARGGLDESAADHDDAPITAPAAASMLEAAADAASDPALALTLAAELPLRRYGFPELLAGASADVEEALAHLARYAALLFPELEGSLTKTEDETVFAVRIRNQPRGLGRFPAEYVLGAAFAQIRRESGHAITARRVFFGHARPRDIAAIARVFETTELEFGAVESGFAISRADAARPLARRDPRLVATLSVLADASLKDEPREEPLASRVAARIEALLPDANVDTVADKLHMSARTLQRRLEEEGTRFSEVLDGVREKRARDSVADAKVPLGEVSFRLGFSDAASFGRAFKRWTGKPPGAYRVSARRGRVE